MLSLKQIAIWKPIAFSTFFWLLGFSFFAVIDKLILIYGSPINIEIWKMSSNAAILYRTPTIGWLLLGVIGGFLSFMLGGLLVALTIRYVLPVFKLKQVIVFTILEAIGVSLCLMLSSPINGIAYNEMTWFLLFGIVHGLPMGLVVKSVLVGFRWKQFTVLIFGSGVGSIIGSGVAMAIEQLIRWNTSQPIAWPFKHTTGGLIVNIVLGWLVFVGIEATVCHSILFYQIKNLITKGKQ